MIILKHNREVNISWQRTWPEVWEDSTTQADTVFAPALVCTFWASWFIWQNSARFMLADTLPQYHQQLPSSLNFITIYIHHYLLLSPLTIITTNLHHNLPSSPPALTTTNHHHHQPSSPPTITINPHHHLPLSPATTITTCHHHHQPSSLPPIITKCALIWVWNGCSELAPKARLHVLWFGSELLAPKAKLPLLWFGCEMGAQSLRPKHVYLYSGGMFILMSSTDDTKYIPCNRAIDASALILHCERKSIKGQVVMGHSHQAIILIRFWNISFDRNSQICSPPPSSPKATHNCPEKYSNTVLYNSLFWKNDPCSNRTDGIPSTDGKILRLLMLQGEASVPFGCQIFPFRQW